MVDTRCDVCITSSKLMSIVFKGDRILVMDIHQMNRNQHYILSTMLRIIQGVSKNFELFNRRRIVRAGVFQCNVCSSTWCRPRFPSGSRAVQFAKFEKHPNQLNTTMKYRRSFFLQTSIIIFGSFVQLKRPLPYHKVDF